MMKTSRFAIAFSSLLLIGTLVHGAVFIFGIPHALSAPSVINPPSAGSSLIEGGLDNLASETDLPGEIADPREAIVNIINEVLSYLALIAVIAIVVAGLVLMLGMGSEASTGRAKKIIIYTIVGLAIIFFAKVIVSFFTQDLASQLTTP